MSDQELEKLKYPTGRFIYNGERDAEFISLCIASLESFPERLKAAVSHLSDQQLDTPYRPGGWTIRQVVHHCADSHMNGMVRFKLILTEDKPVIKPYFEDRWAELTDGTTLPVQPSLAILEGLHSRLVTLLNSLKEEDFTKTLVHPEHNREISLSEITALYSWHGRHHLAHITSLIERKGWK